MSTLTELTPRQAQALSAVQVFRRDKGRFPTASELGHNLGITPQSADRLIDRLRLAGRLVKAHNGGVHAGNGSTALEPIPQLGSLLSDLGRWLTRLTALTPNERAERDVFVDRIAGVTGERT